MYPPDDPTRPEGRPGPSDDDDDDYDDYGQEVVSGSRTGFATNQVKLKTGEKSRWI